MNDNIDCTKNIAAQAKEISKQRPRSFRTWFLALTFISTILFYGSIVSFLPEKKELLNFKSLDGGSTRREGAILMLEVPADQGNAPFNKQKWLHGTKPEEAEEIKKLIKQRLLEDKSMEELKQLLGTDKYGPCYYRVNRVNCYFHDGGNYHYILAIKAQANKPNKVYFNYYDPVI